MPQFYENELRERQEICFPPFSRLIDLVLRGKNEEKVQKEIKNLEVLASRIKEENNFDKVEVFSSSPCFISKKACNFRFHILLLGISISDLLRFTYILNNEYKAPSGIQLEIDVDPVSIY